MLKILIVKIIIRKNQKINLTFTLFLIYNTFLFYMYDLFSMYKTFLSL